MLGLNVYLSRYCLVAIVYFTLSISGCVFAFIAVAKAKKVIAPFDPSTTLRAPLRSGSNDSHRLNSLGGCYTYFYCPVLRSEAIATPYLSGGFSQ